MLTSDIVRLSWLQIFRNKRRYRAAIIGISLGIAGLIAVVTIGDSVEATMGQDLEILGSATIVKADWDARKATQYHWGQYYERDIAQLEKLPGALAVAPAVWAIENAIGFEKRKYKGRLYGVGPVFFKAVHLPVASGRVITDPDIARRAHVCVIGEKLQEKFVGKGASAIGKFVEIRGLSFQIVGVLGSAADPQYLESVLIPFNIAREKIPGMYEIRAVYVRAVNWDAVPKLHAMTEKVLKEAQPGYAEYMHITYERERIKAIVRIVNIFKYFLWTAIVVTLLLGGLGITMIMLAVVVERTKEIGLRKAVGAGDWMIMAQFLCEALTVSLIGAILGIVAGALAVQLLQFLLNVKGNMEVFVISILASVIIGCLLGILSGVLPAAKAMRQDPVEAMRFE
jgi:putative ABC transport system permease protein